jgi:hypothetical protein
MWGILQEATYFAGDLHLRPVFTARALFLTTALLVFSTSFANAAGQVVYRWTDESGNQVNSDRPPPLGVEYETISTSSSMVHTVEPENSPAPPAANPEEGKEAAASPVAEAPASQKNPEFCATAKSNLSQLETHARIRLRDDNGEVRYLSEEEKAVEKQKAQDAIKAFCE